MHRPPFFTVPTPPPLTLSFNPSRNVTKCRPQLREPSVLYKRQASR
jgi:hypothetical protein